MRTRTLQLLGLAAVASSALFSGCGKDEIPAAGINAQEPYIEPNMVTNMVAIGWKTGQSSPANNVVLIGDYANTTNEWELVIKFTDGSELRQPIPRGKIVDFRAFWNYGKTNR